MMGIKEINRIHDDYINLPDLCVSNRRVIAFPADGSPPFDFETAYKAIYESVVLSGLTSTTGIQLNGKYGQVVGMDGLMQNEVTGVFIGLHRSIKEADFRFYVRLDSNPDRVIKVKVSNIRLRPLNVTAITPELSDEQVMSHLQWLVSDGPQNSLRREIGGRLDIDQRMALVQSWVDNTVIPDDISLPCCDASVNGRLDTDKCPLLRQLSASKTACFGTGFVNFNRINIGLTGNGTETCIGNIIATTDKES
jgi:hypothetical protein